jgi:gluconolactonase
MSHTSSSRFTVLACHVLSAAVCLAWVSPSLGQTAAASAAPSTTAAAATPAVTPAIPGVVKAGTAIELVKEGFTGTEGPVTLPDGSLIFTETQATRITRVAADGTTSVFVEGSNGANGLGFTPNGDLYAVQVLKPRVGIVFPDPKVRTLADNFEGKPFGRPNDLVVDKQGNVYFTDSGANPPPAGQAAPAKPPVETARPAVYRISKQGELKRLVADVERPNGIQLSPDEKVLYVANTLGEYLLAYDIQADSSVGPRRNFARLDGWRKTDTGGSSGADGLAVDDAGRVYVASNTGIQVFSSQGEALGTITLPKQAQNLAFAGEDKQTLYVVGRGAVYRIAVLTPGYSGRAK